MASPRPSRRGTDRRAPKSAKLDLDMKEVFDQLQSEIVERRSTERVFGGLRRLTVRAHSLVMLPRLRAAESMNPARGRTAGTRARRRVSHRGPRAGRALISMQENMVRP